MTRQAEYVATWCGTCDTEHARLDECPGELLATGTERHGWRVLVQTPRGPEVYGCLVAPARRAWRARILTYPGMLWVHPGGGTMKFVGASAPEAERQAIEFIKRHCRRRSFEIHKEVPTVAGGRIDVEIDSTAVDPASLRELERHVRSVRVLYGLERPDREGETDDLSERGLFIRTDRPFPVGTPLRLHLARDGYGVPLRGVVRWQRKGEELGRPTGMGLELLDPHPRYVRFVREQQAGAEAADQSGEPGAPPASGRSSSFDEP